MKVQITARRTGKIPGTTNTIIESDAPLPEHAEQEAKLTFLNNYINRDGKIRRFDSVSKAETFAKLNVTAKIISEDE